MSTKVGEIISESPVNIPFLKDLFKTKFILSKVTHKEVQELLLLILESSEPANIFPLYDFLRCAFLDKANAEWAIKEGYFTLLDCMKALENFTEAIGAPPEAESAIQKLQGNIILTSTQAIANLFMHPSVQAEFLNDKNKIRDILQLCNFLIKCS